MKSKLWLNQAYLVIILLFNKYLYCEAQSNTRMPVEGKVY